MNTAIVFMSKHGTTMKVANLIKDKLGEDDVSIIDIKNNSDYPLERFDTVLIGASIHAGQIQKKMKIFCEKNHNILLEKKIGLFLCCMDEKKKQQQFNAVYSEAIRKHSIANGLLGGEFIFENMNFIERFIVKKISKIDRSVSKIDENAINKFVAQLKSA